MINIDEDRKVLPKKFNEINSQKALKEKVRKAQKETVKKVKQTEGEIWIKDED